MQTKTLFIWLLFLIGISALSGCASMEGFFGVPRQGGAATVTSLGQMPEYYVVKEGDTLPLISRRYDISERAIILWNNLKAPYRVEVGQKLQFFAPKSKQASNTQASEGYEGQQNDLIQQSTISASEPLSDSTGALIQSDTPIVQTQRKQTQPTTLAKDQTKDSSISDSSSKLVTSEIPKSQETKPKKENYYIVRPGDTLIAIAVDNDLTLTQIATINEIPSPYDIYVGQKLLLNPALFAQKEKSEVKTDQAPSGNIAVAALNSLDQSTKSKPQPQVISNNEKSEPIVKEKPEPSVKVTASPIVVTKSANKGSVDYGDISWRLPLAGQIVKENNVWLIQGKYDQSIRSAAKGKVIYAGVGIDGYGQMVIVDHGNNYLSAYGNLSSVNVKEGQVISQGQSVGQLGKFKGQSALDFEVRYQGNLISPSKIFDQNS